MPSHACAIYNYIHKYINKSNITIKLDGFIENGKRQTFTEINLKKFNFSCLPLLKPLCRSLSNQLSFRVQNVNLINRDLQDLRPKIPFTKIVSY